VIYSNGVGGEELRAGLGGGWRRKRKEVEEEEKMKWFTFW
jgi:hypothetical protein